MSVPEMFHQKNKTFPLRSEKVNVILGTTECYSLVFFLNKEKTNIKTNHSIIYIPVYADDDPEVIKLLNLGSSHNGPVF